MATNLRFVLGWWSLVLLRHSTNGLSTTSSLWMSTKSPFNTQYSLNQRNLATVPFPRTWVPIASTMELDPNRPTPLQFMNQRYVTYQDNQNQWVVMDDACCHRLAPLSEGRVDRINNRLECSYHGWAFNSTGHLQRVPQVTADMERTICSSSSSQSCVTSYPTWLEKNVLWIWPWPETPPPVHDDSSDTSTTKTTKTTTTKSNIYPSDVMKEIPQQHPYTYTRDLPYGWDTLVENLIDPSHIPFAHHGIQGKRTDAIPINMTQPIFHGEQGFTFEWEDRTMGMMRRGMGEFRAPFLVWYDAMFAVDPPRPFTLAVLCIPTAPGWSRAIIVGGVSEQKRARKEDSGLQQQKERKKQQQKQKQQQDESPLQEQQEQHPDKKKKTLAQIIFANIPPWVSHLLSNQFLDSDLVFLHVQEQERECRSGTSYFMPGQSDRCIASLRKWIPQYASVMKPPQRILPRPVLFDRWTQHTSHCKQCLAAFQGIQKWRRVTYGILAFSILAIKHGLARVSVLGCLAMLTILRKLETFFKEGEFNHAENH